MKKVKIPVVFRVMTGTGNIVALYPEYRFGGGCCTARTLVRKPSFKEEQADYDKVIAHSRAAKPSEATELLGVLKEIDTGGATIVVRQKWNGKRKAAKS